MAEFLDQIGDTLGIDPVAEAYKRGVKRTELGDLFSEGLGATITDTDRPRNAGYGEDKSYHKNPNNAVDIRLQKGIDEPTIRSFMARNGYEIQELLGPGDPGHDDHRHIAATKISTPRTPTAQASQPAMQNNSILDAVYAEITGEQAPAFGGDSQGVNDPNYASPVVNVTEAGRDLAKRNQSATQAADSALAIFDKSAATMQSVQDQREATLKSANQQIETINSEVQKDTQMLMSQIKDPQAQIAAIDTRLQEIAGMSPIQASLKSIFNANYKVGHLEKMRYAAQVKIENAGEQYKTTAMLQDRLSSIVATRFENEDKFNQLISQGAQLDSNIANDHLGMVQKGFETVMNGIQANTVTLQAMSQQENSALDRIQPTQINIALAQAKKSPSGFATIDGVNVPVQKLQDRANQLEQQDLALQSNRLSIQQQNLAAKEASEVRMITHMTPSELKTAAANGGVFRGVRLNQNALQSAYQSSLQTQALAVNGTLESMESESWGGQLRGLSQEIKQTSGALRGMGGSSSPKYTATMNQITARITALDAALQKAPSSQRPALQAQFAREISAMREGHAKIVDELATNYTTSPAGRATIKSWLTGEAQSPADAADGIVSLTRGGALPPGVVANSDSGRALSAAAAAQAEVIRLNPNAKGPQLQRLLRDAVTKAATGSWANAVGNKVMAGVIESAKADGHEAGQIRPQDWRTALQVGDSTAFRQWGSSVGLSEAQARAVFKAGESSVQWQQLAKNRAGLNYATAKSELNTLQVATTLRTLDSSASSTSAFRPSQALAEYMTSGSFQNKVQAINKVQGRSTLGDSIVSSLAAGSIPNAIANQGINFRSVSDKFDADRHAAIQERAGEYSSNPQIAASRIIHSVTGIDPTDAQALERAIGTIKSVDQARAAIMGPKFKDPNLARVQAMAAKEWDKITNIISIQNSHGSLGGYK